MASFLFNHPYAVFNSLFNTKKETKKQHQHSLSAILRFSHTHHSLVSTTMTCNLHCINKLDTGGRCLRPSCICKSFGTSFSHRYLWSVNLSMCGSQSYIVWFGFPFTRLRPSCICKFCNVITSFSLVPTLIVVCGYQSYMLWFIFQFQCINSSKHVFNFSFLFQKIL